VAVLLVCTGLCLIPWTVRNYERFGRIFFLRSNAGLELFISTGDDAGPKPGGHALGMRRAVEPGALQAVGAGTATHSCADLIARSFPVSEFSEKAKGVTNDVVGNVKQVVGKVIGSEELQVEGLVQEAKGEAQKKLGDVEGAVGNKI